MAVFGSGIPAGTTISAITGPTTYTLSQASTNATVAAVYGSTAYTDLNRGLVANPGTGLDTVKVGTGFVTTDDVNFNRAFNALNIAGSGLEVGSSAGNATLTLSGGGLIVSGGANTLSVARVALGGAEGGLHIDSGASLALTGALTGTAGLTRSLDGTLTFGGAQYYTGTTTLNGGTTVLPSGTVNPIFYG
jgi:autotransporter-associated beta strand protein